ncbi:MAG: lysozyme inhibitor LprI family protein [Pseudomonadota bacterium]
MARVRAVASVLILLASAMEQPAAAQTPDCAAPQTQLDMNFCAARAYRVADGALNAAWGPAMAAQRAVSDIAADTLRRAQRAWIAYRDLACEAEAMQYQGGSIQPLILSSCLERLTRQRTADLTLLAENN